ncbi:MAG TPA: tetratricopeptide repeat protein, partial [Devosia sp.]
MAKIDDLMGQGLSLHQSGRIAEAQAIYARVLAKEPSHPAANHLTGLAFLQRGDSAAAVRHLQRAVRVRGNDPEYLASLGTALNAAGRPEEALEAFDKSLKLQPNNPAALNNKAMALKALYRHDDAIVAYRAAIALRPHESGFYRNLANTLSELGDWHGAERAYRDALAHRDNVPNALTGLVYTLEALQRKDEAIEIASSYAANYPGESEYHRALGHARWTAGNPEAAAAAYRAAIAANPRDVEAHRMLGSIVPRASEHDPELAAVRQLLDDKSLSEDQRAQLEFTLGTALADMGEDARALEHFSRGNAHIRTLRPFDLEAARSEIEALRRDAPELTDLPPLLPPTGPIFIV